MEAKNSFKRAFLMFNQEDTGYGAGQAPSGYVKIEVRDGKGKLTALVQNLKEDPSKYNCKLYLFKNTGAVFKPVCVGTVPLKKNAAEMKWEFDPANVAKTGAGIDDFGIAAVLVELEGTGNKAVICPLAAYRDKKQEWRDRAREVLYPAKRNERKPIWEEPLRKEDIFNKFTGGIESKYIPPEDAPELNIPESAKKIEYKAAEEPAANPEIREMADEACGQTDAVYSEPAETAEEAIAPAYREEIPEIRKMGEEEQDFGKPREFSGRIADELLNTDVNLNDTSCIFKTNNFCGVQPEGGTNPCAACRLHGDGRYVPQPDRDMGDIEKLKEYFDRFFEKSEPFNNRRRDYKWWKVNSPVYLNNILYQCNIKTPLLFNPAVMMAHFKYRHLIIGIYTDRMKRREYIVCGVPGVYQVDDRPFGDLCRWVQLEGNRPKYGAFGYWLVYMEPKTGKLLSLS